MNSTKKSAGTRFSLAITVAMICLMTAVIIPGVMGAELDVTLGEANHFAILSYSGITDANPATSIISGDIGSSPITGASMSTITCTEMNGYTIYGVDNTYPVACYQGTPADKTLVDLAYANFVTAYGDASGRSVAPVNELGAGNVGGLTLAPGLYKWTTNVDVGSGTELTFDGQGDSTSVWILQTSGTLNMAANTNMVLTNGARAEHIYWQLAGIPGANINTGAHAEGTILSAGSINLLSGASLNGRAFSSAAAAGVTLSGNVVTRPDLILPPVFVPPVLQSAQTNALGDTFILKFDKAMMADPSGTFGNFDYQIGGVGINEFSAAALNLTDNTRIDLTTSGLATPVAFGDVVTLNYNAGTVTSADTGVLATFAASPVSNGVPNLVPTFTSIAPASGLTTGSTSVIITGTGFTGATAVTFGGTAATSFTVDSPIQITATTPAHAAGAVNVVITTPGGIATGPGEYTYVVPVPTFDSITPAFGSTYGGTVVIIAGTNFNGATAVTIGGTAATSYTVDSPLQITATTPAHAAGIVNVAITTAGGTATGTGEYTYVVPVPTFTNIASASGPIAGGTSVIITGTGFTGATSVTFDGTAATSFTVNNSAQIIATTPAHAAGAVDLVITTPGGAATAIAAYTYVAPVPTFTSIAPASGVVPGGTSVIITGTGFTGATAVTFGGTAATSYTVNSPSQITATTPAHAAGVVNVVITTAGGTATGTGAYTYVVIPIPTFLTIAPVSGPIAGGSIVGITGTGFTGATAVTFDGVAATSYTVVNSTHITATTPAHATGPTDVVITTAGGTATGIAAFTNILPGVSLGSAGDFVILSKSGISTTGTTGIVGDIGVSPIAATGITGFGLVADASNQFSTSSLVTGKVYAADYAAPTPANMVIAINDMEAAYTDAATRPSPDHTGLGDGNIGGLVISPGLYKWVTGVTIPTDVTLSGGPNDVWIFQIDQDLVISSDRSVILSGGAQAENIYWVVAGQTTLGSGSAFNGNILDQTTIVFNSGATLNGRALAQTAVTLIGNKINVPVPVVVPVVADNFDSGWSEAAVAPSSPETAPSEGLLAPIQLAPIASAGETLVTGIGPLTSNPLTADIAGMPGVAVSWSTEITSTPTPDALITTVILKDVDPSIMGAFNTALHENGNEIASLAYIMVAQKTGTVPTGPATVTVTASHDWVRDNGGLDAIRIVGITDTGTTQVLSTSFVGYDRDSGYLTFKASSPQNFWAFGLIAVKQYTSSPAPISAAPTGSGQTAPTQAPTASATTKAPTSSLPIMGIVVVAALVIVGAALLFTRRNK